MRIYTFFFNFFKWVRQAQQQTPEWKTRKKVINFISFSSCLILQSFSSVKSIIVLSAEKKMPFSGVYFQSRLILMLVNCKNTREKLILNRNECRDSFLYKKSDKFKDLKSGCLLLSTALWFDGKNTVNFLILLERKMIIIPWKQEIVSFSSQLKKKDNLNKAPRNENRIEKEKTNLNLNFKLFIYSSLCSFFFTYKRFAKCLLFSLSESFTSSRQYDGRIFFRIIRKKSLRKCFLYKKKTFVWFWTLLSKSPS